MEKENRAQRFMRLTGKLRMFFGPATRTDLHHAMTEENRRLLAAQQQAASAQFETVRRADGTTYLVPRDPEDRSLR
ncbi:hypothetical protein V1639_08535 [Pseudarthrobacter sp. J75]|nr:MULTISPECIES: hypothetical protein [unclassified Pseudarthrobacter]MEE2522579.1 hypothetical protein [Pseudarthrobacter sp. J47]MEE2529076.1 hypothetical protein [Pseudarthrobacter sp. J75]MEE2570815.1 hypothetical protein [Pseudarthrobacter sp. J64]